MNFEGGGQDEVLGTKQTNIFNYQRVCLQESIDKDTGIMVCMKMEELESNVLYAIN